MATDRNTIYTVLDEDTYRSLLALCNLKGRSVLEVAAELIQEGLVHAAESEYACGEDAIDLRVFAGVMKVRRQARIRSQLTQIAFEHNQFPTEDTADLLNNLCNLAGIAVDEVARDGAEQKVPLVTDNGFGVGSACRWLQDYLKDGETPVTQVMEQGHRMGFTPAVIRSAKAHLGVHSIRRSTSWVWTIQQPMGIEVSLPSYNRVD